jgi:ribulose-phosphate 3-epimerase
MQKIIPAILPQSYRAIEMGAEKVHEAVDTVQIDFVDGTFASNRTWVFNNKDGNIVSEILAQDRGLPFWEDLNYELDLMVANPLQYMETFIAMGPSKIIFHIEGLDVVQVVAYIESLPEIITDSISFGIAIGIETPVESLAEIAPYVASIQCMGIVHVGFQSQVFDERCIAKVAEVRALYPNKIIAVDGGVSTENIAALALAGANEFVVGSAVFQSPDIYGTIDMLTRLCNTPSTT